jgi:two-component system, NtrC family, response regulator PilR
MNDKRAHILIVDDELSMRQLLELLLAREGYDVTCAENGRKAVSMVEHNSYDLILCDIRLGDISGLDVLKACKKHHPGTVVIMISAYSTTETAVDAMNAAGSPKP